MWARAVATTTVGAAVGCAVVGGVLFAFSSFVMPALARLPPAQGIAAMQSINVTAITRSFLGVFVGTGVVCVVLASSALVRWHEPGAWLRLAGAALYLAGTIAVTRGFHIPRNDALAALDPNAPGSVAAWAKYLESWTAGNHVRAAAAVLAAIALIASLKVAKS